MKYISLHLPRSPNLALHYLSNCISYRSPSKSLSSRHTDLLLFLKHKLLGQGICPPGSCCSKMLIPWISACLAAYVALHFYFETPSSARTCPLFCCIFKYFIIICNFIYFPICLSCKRTWTLFLCSILLHQHLENWLISSIHSVHTCCMNEYSLFCFVSFRMYAFNMECVDIETSGPWTRPVYELLTSTHKIDRT